MPIQLEKLNKIRMTFQRMMLISLESVMSTLSSQTGRVKTLEEQWSR